MILCTDLTVNEHAVLQQLVSLERRGKVRLPLSSEDLATKISLTPYAWSDAYRDLESIGAVSIEGRVMSVAVRCECKPLRKKFEPRMVESRPLSIGEEPYQPRSRMLRNGRRESASQALARYFQHRCRNISFKCGPTNLGAMLKHFASQTREGLDAETQFSMIDYFCDQIDAGMIRVSTTFPAWKLYISRCLWIQEQVEMGIEEIEERRELSLEEREFLLDRGLLL